jgi:flavin reductase (DIM6/NTAB) family NADH-FMN oxidoreductase RutF
MAIDPTSFRQALGQFASGVTVVTSRVPGAPPVGLTVSAFCSVSLDPPLVLVSIDSRSETHAAFRASGAFAVSILAEGQAEVSRLFARPGPDKFTAVPLEAGANGAPLVAGALAHLECAVRSAHEEGDHVVYVGEIRRLAVHPGRPLVYHRGTYRRLGEDEE